MNRGLHCYAEEINIYGFIMLCIHCGAARLHNALEPSQSFQTLVDYSTSIQVNLAMNQTTQAKYKSAVSDVANLRFQIEGTRNVINCCC